MIGSKDIKRRAGRICVYGFLFLFIACLIGTVVFTGAAILDNIPSGAVMFFNLSQCPKGWTELVEAKGRYIVGLPKDGTLGATVGVELKDRENRAVGRHTHTIVDPGHSHNIKAIGRYDGNIKAYLSGSTNQASNLNSEQSKTNITIKEAGEVEGTNAPYLQLLICKKN